MHYFGLELIFFAHEVAYVKMLCEIMCRDGGLRLVDGCSISLGDLGMVVTCFEIFAVHTTVWDCC